MNTRDFNDLKLNIDEEIEVTLNDFFWKIKGNVIDYRFEKSKETEGWNYCSSIIGFYWGESYKDGEVEFVKVCATSPFELPQVHGSYLRINSHYIQSIKVLQKKSPTGLDKLSHALAQAGV